LNGEIVTGLPAYQGIQGKSENFMFNKEKIRGKHRLLKNIQGKSRRFLCSVLFYFR